MLVAFGSISLNILNTNGEPVRQWAYSSIFLKNKEASKYKFCPDLEETESLYIFDQDAVNHLIFLSNKTNRKKFAYLLPWFFIIILLIGSFTFFSSYFRIVIEKIALSITSAEQESNLGNIMLKEMSEVSYCDINKTNEYLHSLEKNYVSITDDSIELIFMNFRTMNSILLPGRKLLVPYSILENEDGAFVLAETIKLGIAATKNKEAIEKFFSKQRSKALLTYVFGVLTDLNFNKDNGLLIGLHGKSRVLDKVFTDNEWLTLKKLCRL